MIMRIGGFAFIGWCLLVASCKTAHFEVKDGNTARQLLRYNQSIGLLTKEFTSEKDPLRQQTIALALGDSYRRFNDYANAESWYKKSAELNGGAQSLYWAAMMQKQQEKYAEAAKTFEQYQRLSGGAFEGRLQANQCLDAAQWKQAFTRLRVIPLDALNSPSADYGLEPYKGNKWIFTSSRQEATGDATDAWTGEKFTDLFITDKQDPTFSTPYSFGAPVNTAAHEASATLSTDGKEMYFVRCQSDPEASNQYCHLYYTAYNNEHWSEPVKLDLFADSVNVLDPYLSKSGSLLLLAADANDNFGGTDLYLCTRTDSGWSRPRNLGSAINTPGHERFPWLDDKGNLYFSSDGLPGMGGLDVFRATRTKSGYKDPSNLKYPINSGADDFKFRIDKYKPLNAEDTVLFAAFFSSNRAGGKGSDDLYRVEERWINLFVLHGTTVEKQRENPDDPDSKILGLQALPKTKVDLKDTDGRLIASVFSDANGQFTFRLQPESSYKVTGTHNGYFTRTESVSTVGLRHPDSTFINLYVRVELEKIFTQKEIVIPNIYYDYDKATLRAESKLVLDTVFEFFRENPDLTIEIGSHTDSRGSDAYNLKLSQARAQSVVDYLVQKGIPAERLQAKGYGETKLVNNCGNGVPCSEEEHQKNRRTTFRVISAKLNMESVEPQQIPVDPKPEKK